MIKIIATRSGGKTTQLIRLSAETGNYIVCANYREVQAIIQKAKALELNIPFPLTYSEFIDEQYRARGIKGFLIDNVERLVQEMTTVKINAITLSIDDNNR